MTEWDELYAHGIIDTEPSVEIVKLAPRLKGEGITEILDAGVRQKLSLSCKTGIQRTRGRYSRTGDSNCGNQQEWSAH